MCALNAYLSSNDKSLKRKEISKKQFLYFHSFNLIVIEIIYFPKILIKGALMQIWKSANIFVASSYESNMLKILH